MNFSLTLVQILKSAPFILFISNFPDQFYLYSILPWSLSNFLKVYLYSYFKNPHLPLLTFYLLPLIIISWTYTPILRFHSKLFTFYLYLLISQVPQHIRNNAKYLLNSHIISDKQSFYLCNILLNPVPLFDHFYCLFETLSTLTAFTLKFVTINHHLLYYSFIWGNHIVADSWSNYILTLYFV